MTTRLIANKYREGKAKRTLKRELKVLEIVKGEANIAVEYVLLDGRVALGQRFPLVVLVAPICPKVAKSDMFVKVKAFDLLSDYPFGGPQWRRIHQKLTAYSKQFVSIRKR